jgi:hypothetical protein
MVGTMKRVHLTQTYELTITVEVDVPDTFTAEDTINTLTDFPINATVNPAWHGITTGDEVIIGNLCVDYLDSLSGGGATVITDADGNEVSLN